MGRHGEIWGDLARRRSAWGDMARYGEIWRGDALHAEPSASRMTRHGASAMSTTRQILPLCVSTRACTGGAPRRLQEGSERGCGSPLRVEMGKDGGGRPRLRCDSCRSWKTRVGVSASRPRNLGRPGETWGDLGRPGETWGDLGRPGEIWGDLGRPGEIWRDLVSTPARGHGRAGRARRLWTCLGHVSDMSWTCPQAQRPRSPHWTCHSTPTVSSPSAMEST